VEWIIVHDDHVAAGRAAYAAYAEALGLAGRAASWDNLPAATRVGWLRAAGVAGHDALTNAANSYAKARMPAGWLDQIRADAADVLCHRLPPAVKLS